MRKVQGMRKVHFIKIPSTKAHPHTCNTPSEHAPRPPARMLVLFFRTHAGPRGGEQLRERQARAAAGDQGQEERPEPPGLRRGHSAEPAGGTACFDEAFVIGAFSSVVSCAAGRKAAVESCSSRSFVVCVLDVFATGCLSDACAGPGCLAVCLCAAV